MPVRGSKNMTKGIIAAVLLGALIAMPAFAAAPPASPDAVRKAAEAGNAEAQLNLGILYEYGFRLKGNKVEALAWYMAAADQGLEMAAKHRDKLMHELTPAQVEQARQKSKKIARAPMHPQPAPPVQTAPMPEGRSAPISPETAPMPESGSAAPSPETAPIPAPPAIVPGTSSSPGNGNSSDDNSPEPPVQTEPLE